MSMYEPIPEVKISAEDVWNPELREQYQRQQEHYTGGYSDGGHVKETDIKYSFEDKVDDVIGSIANMLIEKNRKYGDSALNPARIFSKADNVAQLHTRIDDKLSRIKNSSPDDNEDAVTDLLGYLILLKIAENDGA